MAEMKKMFEAVVHGIFLLLGLITVGCVLLITVYLIISGIPAIQKIGLVPFLTGKVWSSTSAEPKYGILPFILKKACAAGESSVPSFVTRTKGRCTT